MYYPNIEITGDSLDTTLSGGETGIYSKTISMLVSSVTAGTIDSISLNGTLSDSAVVSSIEFPAVIDTDNPVTFDIVVSQPVWSEGPYDISACATSTATTLTSGLTADPEEYGTIETCSTSESLTAIRTGTWNGYLNPEWHARVYVEGEI